MRLRLVIHQGEILEAERQQILYRGIEIQGRQRPWRARQLQARLLQMVGVEMRIAQGMHEFPGR